MAVRRGLGPPGWVGRGFVELRLLGGARCGRVVLARDVRSGRLVAVRYVPARLLVDRRRAARLREEVAALRRVKDARVARVRRYAQSPRLARLDRHLPVGDGAAIVSDAVDGVSLHRLLAARHVLPPWSALSVLRQSLLGLAALHRRGLVHRGYQPARVMVDVRGSVRLVDVCLGLLSCDGVPGGDPVYRAPELWGGAPESPAADVYAATCVFVECLAGGQPYRGGELFTLMSAHTTAAVPVDRVPPPLRLLVLWGMAKDPAHRPDAAALAAQVDAAGALLYGRAWERAARADLCTAGGAAAEFLLPRVRRHRAVRVLVAAGLVAAVVLGADRLAADVRSRQGPGATVDPLTPRASSSPGPRPSTVDPTGPTSTQPAPTARANSAPERVDVPADADIFAAGLPQALDLPGGGGSLPPAVLVGSTVDFSFTAFGEISCADGAPPSGPDGGTCAGPGTDLEASGSISGIVCGEATGFLVGVFTTDDPADDPTPSRLDFSASALGTDVADPRPELNQTFFIGDGRAGDGSAQHFAPPPGATHLSLGIAAGPGFQGPPGYYGGNTGRFVVTVTRARDAVPVPSAGVTG